MNTERQGMCHSCRFVAPRVKYYHEGFKMPYKKTDWDSLHYRCHLPWIPLSLKRYNFTKLWKQSPVNFLSFHNVIRIATVTFQSLEALHKTKPSTPVPSVPHNCILHCLKQCIYCNKWWILKPRCTTLTLIIAGQLLFYWVDNDMHTISKVRQ